MRSFGIILFLFLCIHPITAQVPVKHDILAIVGEIPAPPATAKDAYAGVTVDEGTGPATISAAGLFRSVEARLKAAEDDYKAQESAVRNAVPPGMNPDMARMAQDPEFKKKMKSMSKEERMKLAMQMMSSSPNAGAPVLKPEPPAVRAALDEWQKLAATMQAEFERGVALQNAFQTAAEADQKGHDEIRAWEEAAIAALPKISSGEMSAPDPAKVKRVRLQAADKHIALADKRLAAMAKEWASVRDHVRSRYATFYAKLIAADYAAGSPNPSTQKLLSDGQMTTMKDVALVNKLSRDAYEAAAAWIAHRKAIEKQ